MLLPKCTLLVGLILTLLLAPILGKRSSGGSHSYPRGSGLSGGGHRSGGLSGGGHGYPTSGGSHSGANHAYPSSGGGLSGGGSHGYPSSGGSHGYPSSGGGLSGGSRGYPSSGGSNGYPSSGGSHGYPSSGNPVGSGYPSSGGSHTYPSSGKNHGYPSSGGGLSGGGHGYPANKPTTTVHHHYHYSPPQQISYASPYGGSRSYPVYRGTPPTYVYQYKDSGSKYGTLLAGLALMNLGTLGVAAYAAHQANQNHGSSGNVHYKPQPGEVCKFAIKKENGDYEETRIDCQIISSFILQDMEEQKAAKNSTISTVTVTNVTTIVNTTNVGTEQSSTTAPLPGNVMYAMLPNGTLVPVNVTGINIPGVPGIVPNVTQNQTQPAANQGSSVVVTTTTTNTTQLVSALDVKGKPVEVTPGMQCFVIRHSPMSNMRKTVPCGLLQTYADKSLKPNSAANNVPMFTFVAALAVYCVAY